MTSLHYRSNIVVGPKYSQRTSSPILQRGAYNFLGLGQQKSNVILYPKDLEVFFSWNISQTCTSFLYMTTACKTKHVFSSGHLWKIAPTYTIPKYTNGLGNIKPFRVHSEKGHSGYQWPCSPGKLECLGIRHAVEKLRLFCRYFQSSCLAEHTPLLHVSSKQKPFCYVQDLQVWIC